MAVRPKANRVVLGVGLDRSQYEAAGRLAAVMGGSRASAIRAALTIGLAELIRRHPEATATETVQEATA